MPARASGAVRRAARHAGGSLEDGARRLQRHHEGPGLHRRRQAQKLDVDPEDGEHLAALITKIYATPKPIVDRIGELIK